MSKNANTLDTILFLMPFFKISVQEDLRRFFASVNSILTCLQKPKENVLMQLLYSNCVPKLTYGAAVKDLSASEKNQFSVAINNAIQHIFGFHLWQSIRQIREFFHFKSIEDMFSNAKRRFLNSNLYHKNDALRFLSQLVREAEENERSKVP